MKLCGHNLKKQKVSKYRSDNYVCTKCGKEFRKVTTGNFARIEAAK